MLHFFSYSEKEGVLYFYEHQAKEKNLRNKIKLDRTMNYANERSKGMKHASLESTSDLLIFSVLKRKEHFNLNTKNLTF